MPAAIDVRGLSKLYALSVGDRNTLRHMSARWWASLTGKQVPSPFDSEKDRQGPTPDTFWALRDVSFRLDAGQFVGVLGANGSGKSTLLRILCRITRPTSGTATLRGRVIPILQVGTGFHPDLTGRENVYLNASILGVERDVAERQFSKIAEFAEIGPFLERPVKEYSSGMYLRLAFSIATHLEPDIMLLDEVLAVGDAAFQRKCLQRLKQICARGCTIVLVTHDASVVEAHCERVLWIHRGQLRQEGLMADVLASYLEEMIPETATD